MNGLNIGGDHTIFVGEVVNINASEGAPAAFFKGQQRSQSLMLKATSTLGELVLLGGGHAQVAVLRQFAMSPLPGLRLTLVTPEIRTAYSGMLPGFVEGKWSDQDFHIDLARLAQMANARLILD